MNGEKLLKQTTNLKLCGCTCFWVFIMLWTFFLFFFSFLRVNININKWLDLNSHWKWLTAQETSSGKDKKFLLSYTETCNCMPFMFLIVSGLKKKSLFYSVILPGSSALGSKSLFSWHFHWFMLPCNGQGIWIKLRMWEQ